MIFIVALAVFVLLDIKYPDIPNRELIEIFYQRRNFGGNIFNESGVWRYRELLNFVDVDTESVQECSKILVSLDGSEGRYFQDLIK